MLENVLYARYGDECLANQFIDLQGIYFGSSVGAAGFRGCQVPRRDWNFQAAHRGLYHGSVQVRLSSLEFSSAYPESTILVVENWRRDSRNSLSS